MSDVFPNLATVSLNEAQPGSIVRIGRYDGCKIALVTNHIANNVRSFVWLNASFQNKPPVIFAENWRNDSTVLQYASNVRFELGHKQDPTGHNTWQMPAVIVSIGAQLFIRAAPFDHFDGGYKLVNLQDGSVYSDQPPSSLWTFLSWQLWLRDPEQRRDLMLTEFDVTAESTK